MVIIIVTDGSLDRLPSVRAAFDDHYLDTHALQTDVLRGTLQDIYFTVYLIYSSVTRFLANASPSDFYNKIVPIEMYSRDVRDLVLYDRIKYSRFRD